MMLDCDKEQLKLMAAAIYEIRGLLSHALESENDEYDTSVRLAAHLSYALHNEALEILEQNSAFNIDDARSKIIAAEKIVSSEFADNFNLLTRK